MKKIRVAIIVGSDSDLPAAAAAAELLEEFGVPFRINIASAHRTPERVREFVKDSEKQGAEVFIACA
ncbi:MAG: AIR carboxylase family protein, partial [Endomicrobiales bacterium]